MAFDSTIWRIHPQTVKRFLYLDQPQVIFVGQATDDVNYPLSEFAYGSTSGSASAVEIGMLVLFGSTAGADDLGRGWVRKLPDISGSTMFVNRSPYGTHDGESNIVVGSYFTVLDTYPLYARHPYIDPLSNIVYKDFDLDWPSYGKHLRPVVNIDGGVCGVFFDDGSGYASVTLDATSSFAPTPGDTITAWQMSVADGTLVSGSLTSSFAVVKFPVGSPVSRRWITVQATTSAGQITRRHYLIIVAPTDGTGLLTQFEISGHALEVAGTKITFQVRVDIPLGTYIDSMIGCYVEKETFGTTHGSMGGPVGKEHIKFSGWFQKNPNDIKTDTTGIHKDTKLEFLDSLGRMALLPSFSQLVERRGTAANTWQQMVAPDIDQYLAMLWLMHSTAPFVCDFHVSGHGSSYPFTVLGSSASNLFDQINKRSKAIQHLLVCDPWGRVYVRGNSQRMITAAQAANPAYAGIPERNETVIVSLIESDMGDVQWDEERPPRQHWLRGGAIQAGTVDASEANRIVPMLNIAPGQAPGQGASEGQDDESLAINQTEINAVVGHAYAQTNLPIPNVSIPLLNFNGIENFAPSLLSWVEFPNSRLTSRRKRYFGTTRFLPIKIDITHNIEAGTKTVKLTLQQEAIGLPAETEPIPVDPTIPVDNAFSIPELVFPTPVPPPPPPTLNVKKGQTHIAIFCDDGYFYVTTNFGSGNATHWTRSNRLSTATGLMFLADPWSPLFQGTGSQINGWVLDNSSTVSYLSYVSDVLGTPSVIHTTDIGGTAAMAAQCSMDFSFGFRNYGVASGGNAMFITLDGGATWIIASLYDPLGQGNTTKFTRATYMSPHKRLAYAVTPWPQLYPVPGVMYASAPLPGWNTNDAALIIAPGTDGPNFQNYFDNHGDIHVPYNNNPDDMIAYFGSTGYPKWPLTIPKPYDWMQVFDFTLSDYSEYWSFLPNTGGPADMGTYVAGVGYQSVAGYNPTQPPDGGQMVGIYTANLIASMAGLTRTFTVDRMLVEGSSVPTSNPTNVMRSLNHGAAFDHTRYFNNGGDPNFYWPDTDIVVGGPFVRNYTTYTANFAGSNIWVTYLLPNYGGTPGQVTISKVTLFGRGPNPFRSFGSLSLQNSRLLLRTLDGIRIEDISPIYGGETYGPWQHKQMSTSLKNRQMMVAALGNLDQSLVGVWTSKNAGTTWQNLVTPVGPTPGRYERAVLSYDGKNQIYLLGTKGYIGISTDWIHVKSQTGDLLTNYPTVGKILSIMGHAT